MDEYNHNNYNNHNNNKNRNDLNIEEDYMNEWKELFFMKSSKILNPCDARLEFIKENNSSVEFYLLHLESIEGLSQRLQQTDLECKLEIQLNLIDMLYKRFFGLTWTSPSKKIKDISSLSFNESVYFCTALKDQHLLIVVELVLNSKDGKRKSLAWSAFRPFASNNESIRRLGFYAGTPRALLYLEEPFEKNKHLHEITGLYLNFNFAQKKKLSIIKSFLPENIFLGRFDKIGGIFNDSSIKTSLEKPRLVPQMSVIIDDLFVYLTPNVNKFESEFTHLIAQDKSVWDNMKIEPSMITISERRLKIGVHNGWRYVHDPYVVQLSVDDPNLNNKSSQFSSNKRLSLKSSLRPKTIETDSTNSNANKLVMRNSVVLDQVFEDPLCAIVFQIEYVITIPIQINLNIDPKNKNIKKIDTKKQFETHHVLVRWASYCPFSSNLNYQMEDQRVEINMFGQGLQTLNPDNKLVFKRPDTLMHDEQSAKLAPGKITFDIKKGNHVNFKQRHYEDEIDIYDRNNDYDSNETQKQLNDTQLKNNLYSKSVMDLYNSMLPKQQQQQQQDDKFQTPEANLLMSQILAKASESQRLVGLFGGNLELYPIYNPAVHQPVLALTPGQIGGRTMSRAAYAKLHSANFPSILNRFGKIAEVIDSSTFIQFDLNKEESDMLACNQIIFQFLAFSRTMQSLKQGLSDAKPKSIYLTFQFYRFPEFKTPKLKLDKIIEDYSMSSDSTPFILKHVDLNSNQKSNESPGYMISYSVDPTNLKFGEKKLFLSYLAHQMIYIDVWDGDSLHLIGTCSLQLKDLLRQGKEAVQSMFELDVISTEYDDDSRLNSGNIFKEASAYSNNSHIKFQGLLHLRIGNVGSPILEPSDPIKETSLAPPLPFTRVIASKSSLNSFGASLLSKKIDETTSEGFISHHYSKAHHMADTFKDIHAALVSKSNKNLHEQNDILDPLKKRKLNRMEMVRKIKEIDVAPKFIGNHKRVIEERSKDLQLVENYIQILFVN